MAAWVFWLALLVTGCAEREAPDAAPPLVESLHPDEQLAEDAGVEAPDAPGAPRQRLIDATRSERGDWLRPGELPPMLPIEDIETALERAAERLAAGALLEPVDDNALALYLAVLEVEPANLKAREGVDAVVLALRVRAEAAEAEGDLEPVQRTLPILLRLRPDDPDLLALKERLERAQRIAELLEAAQRAMAAGQLTQPADDSALGYYQAVLVLAPDHPEARRGLMRVANALIERAIAAGRQSRFAEADRLLNESARIRPGSRALLDARSRLFELRDRRGAELLQNIDASIEAGELARAEALIRDAQRELPELDGLDERVEALELARIYGRFRPREVFRDPFLNSTGSGPAMVVLPRESFLMGSPDNEPGRQPNEGPQREIRFRRAFALAQTETTVAEFQRFVESTGYRTDAERAGNSSIYDEQTGRIVRRNRIDWRNDYAGGRATPDLPVVHVTWNDAKAYAAWLSEMTGQAYRLPSEAEFEFALRAGSTTRYWWGDGPPQKVVANVTGDGDRSPTRRSWTQAFRNYSDGFWGPAPVGMFPPNPFGLHDIDGNVSEWVEDCWHDSYRRGPTDGRAWVNPGCDRRVVRGASWGSAPDQVRSAFRIHAAPDTRGGRVGFRVARDL